MGAHRIALYKNRDNVSYFNNFGVEYIPKDIKILLSNKLLKQIFTEYK